MDGRMTIPALHRGVKVSKTGRWLAGHARHRGGEKTTMARFELHKTFLGGKDSELVASADRLSEAIRAWGDDPEATFAYVVLNTEADAIVWRPESVAVFPAPERDG